MTQKGKWLLSRQAFLSKSGSLESIRKRHEETFRSSQAALPLKSCFQGYTVHTWLRGQAPRKHLSVKRVSPRVQVFPIYYRALSITLFLNNRMLFGKYIVHYKTSVAANLVCLYSESVQSVMTEKCSALLNTYWWLRLVEISNESIVCGFKKHSFAADLANVKVMCSRKRNSIVQRGLSDHRDTDMWKTKVK